jgi:hypothetical protein
MGKRNNSIAAYTMPLMKLEEVPVVTVQLTDQWDGNLEIGISIEMVTFKISTDMDNGGIFIYGYKFKQMLACAP